MYINPFVAGILVTIFAELLLVVIASFFASNKGEKE